METNEKEDVCLCECNGYCDAFDKRIAVENEYNENAPGSIKNFSALLQKVKRHECIHAMFFESGMTEWQNNENLVDWIAIQFPKMLEIFKQIDAF